MTYNELCFTYAIAIIKVTFDFVFLFLFMSIFSGWFFDKHFNYYQKIKKGGDKNE